MKLHLGCGKRDFGSDWIHIDGGDYSHLHSNDIVNLPFESESVDLIYACHVLEYFDRYEAQKVLMEWNRVLKAEGILRLAVPNFETMCILYMKNKICPLTNPEYEDWNLESFLGPLYGKMKMGDKYIYHKTVYDFKSLKELLESEGFININKYNRWETEHAEFDDHSAAYLPHMNFKHGTLISLNVEAIKCAFDPII